MADHLTEEQQVEAIKGWWKENGVAVIAGVVIGLAALFGWRGWNDYKETNAAEASTLYGQFQLSLNANDKQAANDMQQQFFTDYASTPYASLAALATAKQAVNDKDAPAAKQNLQWVLDNSKQAQIAHTARVRLAAVLMNDGEYDAALTLLTVKSASGYAGIYEELKGDILLAKGDVNAAHSAYNSALQSSGLSAAMREIVNAKFDDTNPLENSKPEIAK